MISRSLVVGVLAAGCLTAAAAGSYVAVRQNDADVTRQHDVQPPAAGASSTSPVAETEAVVTAQPEPAVAVRTAETTAPVEAPAAPERPLRRETRRSNTPRPRSSAPEAQPAQPPAPAVDPEATRQPAVLPPIERPAVETPVPEPEPPRPVEPVFDELVVPASSVIGLEVQRTVSSEQASVEDRVDARVTRDVYVDGRLVIPAGSRAIGNVTLVERGGKMKERARLGVRFHTLVLGDGRQMTLRTDTVYREGDSPASESSRKIGGAAVGGAVLGAIFGGSKGAAAGAAVGAAGGTAAVMAGGRNPAVLASGSVVTIRLAAPLSVEVAR